MEKELLEKLIVALSSGADNFPTFSEDELTRLLEYYGKAIDGKGAVDSKTQEMRDLLSKYSEELAEVNNKLFTSPEGKKILEEAMRKKKKERLSEAASEGLAFVASFGEINSAIQGIADAKQELKGVVEPAKAALSGESRELLEAADMARDRALNPYSSAEINAILRSTEADTLKGLQTAKQVSGGQASSYQAAAQDAIDRGRFAKLQTIPILQEGIRKAETDYASAATALDRSRIQRDSLALGKQRIDENRYMFDKGLAWKDLATQRGNMLTALQNAEIRLPNAIGGSLARLYPRRTYSGLGSDVDSQNNHAIQTINRIVNQNLLDLYANQGYEARGVQNY